MTFPVKLVTGYGHLRIINTLFVDKHHLYNFLGDPVFQSRRSISVNKSAVTSIKIILLEPLPGFLSRGWIEGCPIFAFPSVPIVRNNAFPTSRFFFREKAENAEIPGTPYPLSSPLVKNDSTKLYRKPHGEASEERVIRKKII